MAGESFTERFIDHAITIRGLVFLLCALLLGLGAYSFRLLPIEAYPNIAPLNIQIITQWAGRSTLEIERQLTIPIETAMAGVPDVDSVRSVSLFGLSVVTIKFREGADNFKSRQNTQLYLSQVTLPSGITPTLSPDADATGEILRYRLESSNPAVDIMDLKSLQDWEIFKDLKSVSGVADVNGFGGMVKQYQVLVDPMKLQNFNVTLNQLVLALSNGNANVGGGLMPGGEQQYVVRGVGLVKTLDDIRNIVVANVVGTGSASRLNAPIRVGDLAAVQFGNAERLGQVQFDKDAETVEGIVLMRRGQSASEVLARVRTKVNEINASGRLPAGAKIAAFYDRQELLNLTVNTVTHTLLFGIALVLLVLWLFLGNLRMALIVATIIPLGLCVSFTGMNWFGVPANLISLGGNRHRKHHAVPGASAAAGAYRVPCRRCRSFAGDDLFHCDHHCRLCTAVHNGRRRGQDLRTDGVHDGSGVAGLDSAQHHFHTGRHGDAVFWRDRGALAKIHRLAAEWLSPSAGIPDPVSDPGWAYFFAAAGSVRLVGLLPARHQLPADSGREQPVDPRDAAQHGQLRVFGWVGEPDPTGNIEATRDP
jgi:cobalt-zinc-cadmium resistance protein CzcA